MKLIDKAAVVAEIEKRQKEEVFYDEDGSFASWADQNYYSTLESIKNSINTLEAKEVDLEDIIKKKYLELRRYGGNKNMLVVLNELQFNDLAGYFFELGLKVEQKGK